MNIIEQRTVCDECGMSLGGFHKNCDGNWVTERRTVTPWRRTRNTIVGPNPRDIAAIKADLIARIRARAATLPKGPL